MKLSRFVLSGTALLLACALSTSAAPRYTIQDLGMPAGAQVTRARSINNSGVVAGGAQVNSTDFRPFIYRNGKISYIEMPSGIKSMSASSVNDSGQVLLAGQTSGYESRTFIWQEGKGYTPIDGSGSSTSGKGINSSGQVAGFVLGPDNNYRAFVTGSPNWTYVYGNGALGDVFITALNDLGQVAGYEYDGAVGNIVSRPIFWDGTQTREIDTFGGGWNEAEALNNKGQVVGSSSLPDGSCHAFMWQGGTTTDLGTFHGENTFAEAINELGQVVGWSDAALLWEKGTVTDLSTLIAPDSGWQLYAAYDINNLGQIIGDGYYQGSYRSFLLTPVPEPSSLASLAAGFAGICGMMLRRRK